MSHVDVFFMPFWFNFPTSRLLEGSLRKKQVDMHIISVIADAALIALQVVQGFVFAAPFPTLIFCSVHSSMFLKTPEVSNR